MEIFPQSVATSTETTAVCPPFVFILTDQQGNNLPADVFDYDENTATLTVETDDVSKAQTYVFSLSVKYEGSQYPVQDDVDVTVEIIDPCLAATLTIQSSILTSLDMVYALYSAADS